MPNEDRIAAFRARCEDRARRWAKGEWTWIGYAVDPLQDWAVATGLVNEIGQDAVQQIMSEAFYDRPM